MEMQFLRNYWIQLLYNCGNDGIYKLAITRLIDFGMVKCVAQNDGKPICLYISND